MDPRAEPTLHVVDSPRIRELRRRVEADPASIAFAQLGEELRRIGAFAEAERVCRAGLARHSAYLSARVTLGRALLELGLMAEAAQELQKVIAVAPDNLAAMRALADIQHRQGNFDAALEYYERALLLAPRDPELGMVIEFLKAEMPPVPLAPAPRESAPAAEAHPAPASTNEAVREPTVTLPQPPVVVPVAPAPAPAQASGPNFERALEADRAAPAGPPPERERGPAAEPQVAPEAAPVAVTEAAPDLMTNGAHHAVATDERSEPASRTSRADDIDRYVLADLEAWMAELRASSDI